MATVGMQVIVIVFILILGVLDWRMQKDRTSYYYGRLAERKNVIAKDQNRPTYEKILIYVAIVIYYSFFMGIQVYEMFSQKFWDNMNNYYGNIPNTMLTVLLATLSAIGILVAFSKETYVFYSMRDVLVACNVKSNFVYMIFETAVVYFLDFLSAFIFNYEKTYICLRSINLVIFIYFWIDFGYLLKSFVSILLDYKIDRKMLKGLHKEFYYKSVRKLYFTEEEQNHILCRLDEILDYLLYEYEKNKKAVDISTVQDVYYDAFDKITDRQFKWKVRIRCIIYVVVFCSLICFPCALAEYQRNNYIVICFGIFISIVIALGFVPCIQNVFIAIVYGRKGYIWAKKNKYMYTSELQVNHKRDKWVAYTNSAKDILACCCLLKEYPKLYESCKAKIRNYFKNVEEPLRILVVNECYKISDSNKLGNINSIEKKIAMAILRDIDIEGVKSQDMQIRHGKKKKSDIYWYRLIIESIIISLVILLECLMPHVQLETASFILELYDSSKCSDIFAQQFAISAICISVMSLFMENINDRVVNMSVKRIYFNKFLYKPNYITRIMLIMGHLVLAFLSYIFNCFVSSIIIFALGMYQVFRLMLMTYYFLSKRSKVYEVLWDKLQSKDKEKIYEVILEKLTYIDKIEINKVHNSYYRQEIKTLYLINNIAINRKKHDEEMWIIKKAADYICRKEGVEEVKIESIYLAESEIDDKVNNIKRVVRK